MSDPMSSRAVAPRPVIVLATLALLVSAGCSAASGPAPSTGTGGSTSPSAPVDSGQPTASGGAPTSPPASALDGVAMTIATLETSTDTTARVNAIKLLGRTAGDQRIEPALEGALRDADERVRAAAAEAMGVRREATATRPLIAALKKEFASDPASPVVSAAARALGLLKAADAVTVLVPVYLGPAGDGRAAALGALKSIGAPAVAPLAKVLNGSDAAARLLAVDALGAIGGAAAVKALVGVLTAKDVKLRSAAANKLGHLGDRSAEKGLSAMLDDPATGGGNTASVALARLYLATPAKLLHYLDAKATIRIYYGLMYVGAESTVKDLATALQKRGDLEMAEFFLNCGNSTLEQAARDWGTAHGYRVITAPGAGGGQWGAGLPD
jgi:HEAT repeat protein